MTNYANYAYYTDTYKGAVIDTVSFDLYARKATQEIKKYTFNRVQDDNIPDEVRMCCCELAELIFKHDKGSDKENIASEKVGGYSVTYADKNALEQKFIRRTNTIIEDWLWDTGLLYRGQ
jgi:hypothetical protein